MQAIDRTLIVVTTVLGLLALPVPGESQERPVPPPVSALGDTVTVVPGRDYGVGGFGRRILGSGWRAVWLTPVDAPVFDLGSYGGGLDIVRLGGGFQTVTLHLVESDGWREYRFRSVAKFPQQAMPWAIRGTMAGAVLQDQVSTLFPAAPLLVPPLLAAIDALQVTADLYIMPDDPRLGEHRGTFAGMLGTVEWKPDNAPDGEPGFAGSVAVKGTEQFFNDLDESREHRLDEREFLALRLIDFMINDTDRTADNFEWARFDGPGDTYLWRSVARDRDRAFMDARGWLNSLIVRRFYPKLVEFNSAYSLAGLTHTTFQLDRRLLQRLTREDFEQVALRVQRAIDDDVIEAVIAGLPPRWREQTSAPDRLRRVLTARRAGLPAIALAFYQELAGEVDVYGTEEDEYAAVFRHANGDVTVLITGREDDDVAELVRGDDGRVTMQLSTSTSNGAVPFYRRTFVPAETNEVRIYLADGDDVAIVRGAPSSHIIIRVIGGSGADVLVDSAGGGGTHFYDSDGADFVSARGTRVSQQPWIPPEPAAGLRLGRAWRPDWGGSRGWGPVIGYAEGSGMVIGFGPRRLEYGFRRLPHHWSVGANLLVGLASGRFGITAAADYRAENSPLALTLSAGASQLDAFRFRGYGNDTPATDQSLVWQNTLFVEPALVWHMGWRSRESLADPLRDAERPASGPRPLVGQLHAGPVLHWSDAELREESPLAATRAPGADPFGRVGFRIGLQLDRTDQDAVPTRGWTFDAVLAGYAPIWDAAESFSTAGAVASAYVPLADDGPHVALRAGGKLVSGLAPVQYAPAVGGRATLRGYDWDRYTGDTSAYGSTELRVPTGSVSLFVRWQVGVFALADVGRVWFDGRTDGGWHTGLGGGLWLSSLGKGVSVAYAHGEGHYVYLSSGLFF
ncbi:MAG TPA: BamA/TamA family outer membrane protein [Longimicrobiales bacterium]|nr:BamA/TamA family outer membrane protein [Longimicrobiales bacterium]